MNQGVTIILQKKIKHIDRKEDVLDLCKKKFRVRKNPNRRLNILIMWQEQLTRQRIENIHLGDHSLTVGRYQDAKPHLYFPLLDGFPKRVVADRRGAHNNFIVTENNLLSKEENSLERRILKRNRSAIPHQGGGLIWNKINYLKCNRSAIPHRWWWGVDLE